jgi:hypothetical protein
VKERWGEKRDEMERKKEVLIRDVIQTVNYSNIRIIQLTVTVQIIL